MTFSAHSYLLLVFSTTFQEASDTPLFSSPAPLTICTVLQLFTVICSQPSSAVSITAAENYALLCPACLFFFFLKAWAALSWCTVLCIYAQKPTASTAGWGYSGPEAVHCCADCSSDSHEQFIHLQKVTNWVHKKTQTQYLHGQWGGN